MQFHEVDFAICPDGHGTPIRLPTPPELANSPILRQMESETLFVACIQCPHVFRVKKSSLKTRVTTAEFQDERSDGEYRRTYVPIPCDEVDCGSHVEVLVVRSADTTDAAIEAEKRTWIADEVECGEGHKFSLPSGWR